MSARLPSGLSGMPSGHLWPMHPACPCQTCQSANWSVLPPPSFWGGGSLSSLSGPGWMVVPQRPFVMLRPDPKHLDTLGWREWAFDMNVERLASLSHYTVWQEATLSVPVWDEGDAIISWGLPERAAPASPEPTRIGFE